MAREAKVEQPDRIGEEADPMAPMDRVDTDGREQADRIQTHREGTVCTALGSPALSVARQSLSMPCPAMSAALGLASPDTQPTSPSPGDVGGPKGLGLQPKAPGAKLAPAGQAPMTAWALILKLGGIACRGSIAVAILIGIIGAGCSDSLNTGTKSVSVREAAPTAAPTITTAASAPASVVPRSPVATATPRPPTPTRTPSPTATPKIVQVGSEEHPYPKDATVQIGDVRWKLLGVSSRKSLPASFGGERTARGRYVVVSIEVENLGGGKRSVTSPHLLDDEGRMFVSSNDVFHVKPEQIFLIEYLSPNQPFQFTDVYDVPHGASGLMMQVSDLENVRRLAYLSLGDPR